MKLPPSPSVQAENPDLKDVIGRFFRPVHTLFGEKDVFLNAAALVGFMGTGKTTTVRSLFAGIEKRYGEDHEVIHILSRDYRKVFRIHESSALKKRIHEADIINVFLDDAARSAGSASYSAEKIGDWFYIRHYFRDMVGIEEGTVNFISGIQRYNNLMNVLRNAPLLLFKALPVRDHAERRALEDLTRGSLQVLDRFNRALQFDKDRSILEKTLVVPPPGMVGPYVKVLPRRPLNPERTLEIDSLIKFNGPGSNGEGSGRKKVKCRCCGYEWRTKSKSPKCYKCSSRQIEFEVSFSNQVGGAPLR